VFFAAGVGFNVPVAEPGNRRPRRPIKVFRAAEALGGRRVILISAYGTEHGGPDGYNTGCRKHYYAAKQALMASTLLWTILRPGGLTDHPAPAAFSSARTSRSRHPRADVAASAVAALASPASAGHAWSLVRSQPRKRRTPPLCD
jgi:hypothetical protein